MAKPRVFIHPDSQAGCYHVVSRFVERTFRFYEAEKMAFVAMMKAFAALHQVEIVTYCVMSNHFHLLVRVPERPEGFDLPQDEVFALFERAVGTEWAKTTREQMAIFATNGAEEAIEDWRQRVLGRMFSLSAFMQALKQRFSQWYNRKSGRTGTLWESRYTSVVVEDSERALRTMATYIDLNPVRAGMVDDPGAYRWCGYAEAMAGNAEAIAGLVRVTGMTAANLYGQALEAPDPALTETATMRRRRELRALVAYRQLLGLAGRPRTREDGTVVRRGVNEKLRERWEAGRGVKREILLRRVQHFTRGVIFGSREFVDGWFAMNRTFVSGTSRTRRETGARRIGKAGDWRGLFSFRRLPGATNAPLPG